jgi:hypothetical protein
MNFAGLRSQVEALAKRARPRPGRRRKLTTAENRQELDRILTEIDRLPADAAPHPDSTGLAEALAEIDRVLAAMDAREAVA